MKIYTVTKILDKPGGHGYPSDKYIALASYENKENYFDHTQDLFPAFTHHSEAQRFIKQLSNKNGYSSYEITSLELKF